MKRVDLGKLEISQLVEEFVAIAMAQDHANLGNEAARYNRLYDKMKEIEDELKRRSGDQRRVLIALYDHNNPEVRLKAAKATLAVAPLAARKVLESLTENKLYSQAGAAGMCLWALDEGIFKPT